MKFYKRDPDAALAGMAELTLQERGAYNSIIDLLYSRDGVLADDDDLIRRLLGCHGNEWRGAKARLFKLGKLWSEDGYLKAKRVDSVIKEAGIFSETQRIRVGKRWETESKRGGKTEKPQSEQRPVDTKAGNTNTPTPTPTPIRMDGASAGAALPEWLPKAAWDAFVEMRVRARCKPTENAARLLIMALGRMREEGHDPVEILNQSTMNGWRGLFPPKGKRKETKNDQKYGRYTAAIEGGALFLERNRATKDDRPRISSGNAKASGGVDPQEGNDNGGVGALLPSDVG